MILKRNGMLKTRGCANGNVQRLYTSKEKVSSLIPDLCALKFMPAVITRKGRDVAPFYLPGFIFQTDQNKLIILKVIDTVAILFVESDPNK